MWLQCFVEEQVLHRDEAEQRPEGGSHEALLRSCGRETRPHVTASVKILSSSPMFLLHVDQICVTYTLSFDFSSALLQNAHSMPFQVKPSTMASVMKGLHSLRPGEIC